MKRQKPALEAAGWSVVLGLFAGLCPGVVPFAHGENEIGRLTSVGNGSMRRHYSYDVLGRVSSEVHVLDGTPRRLRHAYGYSFSEAPARGPGNVRSDMTFPDGEKVCYSYDSRGALKKVTTRCEGTPEDVLSSVSYDALGRAVETRFGNGAITRSCYDAANLRLDRRRTSFASQACFAFTGTPAQDHSYAYDPVGNVKAVRDLVPGDPASFSATYAFDSLDRLVSRTSAGSIVHYSYDAAGNLVGKEVATAGQRNQSYGGPERGPHALAVARGVTHGYDLNGNLESATDGTQVVWNAENMATSVTSGGLTLAKSFLGESLWKKVDGSGTTYYLPSLRVENGRERKFYESFAERSAEDGQLRFYHPDHLGSSTVVTDLAQTVAHRSAFLPYGEDIGQAGGSFLPRYRFNFKEQELKSSQSAGFYDYGARLYSPATGRWLSPDRLLVDGPNRYAYARNNPVAFVDVDGHQARKVAGVWIGRWENDVFIVQWVQFSEPVAVGSDGKVPGITPCRGCLVVLPGERARHSVTGRWMYYGEGYFQFWVEPRGWTKRVYPGQGPGKGGTILIGLLDGLSMRLPSGDMNRFLREMAEQNHPYVHAASEFVGGLLLDKGAGALKKAALSAGPEPYLRRLKWGQSGMGDPAFGSRSNIPQGFDVPIDVPDAQWGVAEQVLATRSMLSDSIRSGQAIRVFPGGIWTQFEVGMALKRGFSQVGEYLVPPR